jgi:hypothetical protein
MNAPLRHQSKKNERQGHFRACKNRPVQLKTRIETALSAVPTAQSVESICLFERSSNSKHSQAGEFLPWLPGGSGDPIHCGFGCYEPQDTGIDKFEETTVLANFR